MMCGLIKYLYTIEYPDVWAFTSHDELLFTSKDDYKTWLVIVKVVNLDGHQFYRVKAAQKQPWQHVTGFAKEHTKAAELVVEGLKIVEPDHLRNIFFDAFSYSIIDTYYRDDINKTQ